MKSLKNSRIRKSTRLNKLKSKQDLSVHFKIVLDNSNQNPTIESLSNSLRTFFSFSVSIQFQIESKGIEPLPQKDPIYLFISLIWITTKVYNTPPRNWIYIHVIFTGLFIGGRGCPGTNGLFLATTRQLGRGGVVDSSGQRVVRLEKEIERAY